MQREIKFRGISIDTGEFVYGYYVERKEPHDKCQKIYDSLNGTWHDVRPETVGQYIGLKDNTKWEKLTEKERAEWVQIKGNFPSEWKGKAIYEGEIFNCIYHSDGCVNHVFIVSYSSEATKFYLSRRGDSCQQPAVRQIIRDVARYCSIGNIHQDSHLLDPELLK